MGWKYLLIFWHVKGEIPKRICGSFRVLGLLRRYQSIFFSFYLEIHGSYMILLMFLLIPVFCISSRSYQEQRIDPPPHLRDNAAAPFYALRLHKCNTALTKETRHSGVASDLGKFVRTLAGFTVPRSPSPKRDPGLPLRYRWLTLIIECRLRGFTCMYIYTGS